MSSPPDISRSLHARVRRSGIFWPDAPAIVAEALAPVPDPVLTALRPGPRVAATAAARSLARGLLPDEAPAAPPAWLLPHQIGSFRRVVAALKRYRGAMLADPLGSGKTYVALAAARGIEARHPVIAVVPASLVHQWRATGAALGVEVAVLSHEQVSRGRLPDLERGVVVIDEAHRFRNPRTRRYRHLAPWLVGRTVLLVTATPVVNRLADLLHELVLAIRDDALLPDGVPSLGALLTGSGGAPALGRLVVERSATLHGPRRGEQVSQPREEEQQAASATLELLDGLALSRSAPVAALVRAVLLHAAASSTPALIGALRRYRALLLHARDAWAAARPMDRAALRRFTGETGDQLMLWELLPTAGDPGELDPDDLHRVDAVLAAMAPRAGEPDPKLERLREILEDGAVSLVFVARQETVRHLRGGLGRGTAWCTGNRAGLDACAVPRATVLDWFREGPGALTGERAGARHLVVTDVAAEGLDLQRAGRVVHYDLPWTPMRMDQRDGRALRLGSRHARVDIVRFALPPALERALRLETAIRRKRGLPAAVGLGAGGRRLWRWRTELAESLGGDGGEEGVSVVRAGPRGALAGFGLYGLTLAGSARVAFVVGWLDPAGRWTEDEEVMAARLTAAAQSPDGTAEPGALQAALEQLATPIRERLAAMRERRWARTQCHAAARAVAARLQEAVREAARRRDLAALDHLDRALAFVAGGHTAGETLLLERLAQAGDAELLRAASRFPAPTPSWGTVEARLSSVVLFLGE